VVIATFCEDPEATAIRLSKGHWAYSEQETLNKLDEKQKARREAKEKGGKGIGFPSCSAIRTAGAKECATCPQFAKGKSPLNTGVYEGQPDLKFVSEGGKWQPIKGGIYAASDETLAALNERWRYIKDGGQTLLYENKGGEGWILSDEESMKRDLANVQVSTELDNGKNRLDRAADWFIKHPKRLPPANKVFRPNGEVGPNEFNFWGGWGITPDFNFRDDKEGFKPEIRKILEFIAEVICKNKQRKINSFIRLHGWIAQNPGKPPGVYPVLKSPQRGTGKNTFAKIMLKIFGKHGALFQNKEHFFGKHSVFENLCYAVLDEVLAEKDHKSNDLIKGRTTGETIIVEPKYQQAKSITNTVAMLMLSNHTTPVLSGSHERRQLVLELDPKYVLDKQYFKTLHEAIDNGGAEQFLGYLLNIKLEGWTPNNIEGTEELVQQQIAGLSSVEQWLLEVAGANCLLGGDHDGETLDRIFAVKALREAYFESTKHTTDRISSRAIGNILTKYFGKSVKCNNQSVGGSNPDMGYFVPNGPTLRVKIYELAGIELNP
jgi:hypothetical protein